MSKVSSILELGVRSLRNNKRGIQTASHNIASKSVPGYSRQVVDFSTVASDDSGQFPIGKGAQISAVRRQNNPYLERQILKEQNKFGYAEGSYDALIRAEQVFNQMGKGLNESMVGFFNAFRDLSRHPESAVSKTLVTQKAEELVQSFQQIHTHLEEIQEDVRFQISTHLRDINQITKEIVELNRRIQAIESANEAHIQANDERDRRDMLLKKLGSYLDIRYFENKDQVFMVTAGKSLVLVSGNEALTLSSALGGYDKKNPERREGSLDIFYERFKGQRSILVTEQFNEGGKIGALLQMQNKMLSSLQNSIDDLAYTFAKEVNRVHQLGYDEYHKKGEAFFVISEDSKEAARRIRLNENIRKDLKKVVAAAQPYSPADNRIANQIVNLQYQKLMKEGQYSFGEFYRSLMSHVGLWTQQAKHSLDSQSNVLQQLEGFRESLSGVSVDEETAKIIDYQKSYEASARLMQVANELLDTILEIKR